MKSITSKQLDLLQNLALVFVVIGGQVSISFLNLGYLGLWIQIFLIVLITGFVIYHLWINKNFEEIRNKAIRTFFLCVCMFAIYWSIDNFFVKKRVSEIQSTTVSK